MCIEVQANAHVMCIHQCFPCRVFSRFSRHFRPTKHVFLRFWEKRIHPICHLHNTRASHGVRAAPPTCLFTSAHLLILTWTAETAHRISRVGSKYTWLGLMQAVAHTSHLIALESILLVFKINIKPMQSGALFPRTELNGLGCLAQNSMWHVTWATNPCWTRSLANTVTTEMQRCAAR